VEKCAGVLVRPVLRGEDDGDQPEVGEDDVEEQEEADISSEEEGEEEEDDC